MNDEYNKNKDNKYNINIELTQSLKIDNISNYKLNKEGKYECIDCGYSNSKSRLFKDHLSTKRHIKMYIEKLNNKENVEIKEQEEIEEKEIIENIEDYKNEDEEYECTCCSFINRQPNKISKHLDTDKHRKNKKLPLKKKKYKCVKCNIYFASKDSYQKHLELPSHILSKDEFKEKIKQESKKNNRNR